MLPVILSGGVGTRLWPLSTQEMPKQFLSLVGNESMIKQTVNRIENISFMSKPLVVCNEEHVSLVQKEFESAQGVDILLEPARKNTAPAILAAAFYCLENESDGIMLVLPSDHVILKKDVFQNAIRIAYEDAKKNKYALFGIVPLTPETGYGYIEADTNSSAKTFPVKAFKEKPNLETAQKYISAKNYFWNSGMFTIPASLLISEMEKFCPEMFDLVKKSYENSSLEKSSDCGKIKKLDKTFFEKIKGDSIDYAVMEKTTNANVVPLDAAWSDVGSWNMVWELSEKDSNGNAHSNKTFFYNAKNNLVKTQHNLPVAVIGLDDCVIVESSSGIVIAKKDCVQSVKDAVDFFAKK